MSQIAIYDNTTILPDIELLTGNAGGAVGPNAAHNINIVGVGAVVVTGNPATNTLSIDVGGAGVWTRDVPAAVALVEDTGHIPTNVGLTTYTLPLLATLGTLIEIVGESAGLWTIAQNAGQSIQVGNISTTVGVGGSITATDRYDTIKLICRVANTTWSVTSFVGVPNVV